MNSVLAYRYQLWVDHGLTASAGIEHLQVTSPAIKQPKHPPLYSASFIRVYGKKVVISTVILETQAARNLQSTTVSTVAVGT